MKNLCKLGFGEIQQEYIKENNLGDFLIGRIINQQKERYIVLTENKLVTAEVTGNLRFSAQSNTDFPVIGDWVAMIDSGELCLIYQILKRNTILERQAIQKMGETQLIASNIDYALIVQGLDNNFNINRIERYLSVVYAGNIKPIIVLNKSDLISAAELSIIKEQIKARIQNVEFFFVNTRDSEGLKPLKDLLLAEKTYCFIGSSGVGKSSIINTLLNKEAMKTLEISASNYKGKHTTTHKELMVLENGAIVIDTPGMRELGVLENQEGIDLTFSKINELASQCKFIDCTHSNEPGCKVNEAIESGLIEKSELVHFNKLKRESLRFESSKAEKRKKDKSLGKLYKRMINHKKSRKFNS